jgi:hypothetical protein
MSGQGKIFGIGDAKTATSSLGKALEILGYRCIHDPYELLPGFFPDELADFPDAPGVLESHVHTRPLAPKIQGDPDG